MKFFCPFIKPREDPAKLLELSDEAFDEMALFINRLILFARFLTVSLGGNYGNDFLLPQLFNEYVGIIGFVH